MATNPYVNKVEKADGTVIIDISEDTVTASDLISGVTAHSASGAPITGNISRMQGTTITPSRSQQTVATQGNCMLGDVVVEAIPNTYYTAEEALELLFPVGSIYISTSSTAPSFGGTWVETKIPATWGDLEYGDRSYTDGTGSGTLHFWRRTA